MYGNRSRNRLKGWRTYPQTFVLTPLCDLTSLRAMTNNLLHVISILRLPILCDFEKVVPKITSQVDFSPKKNSVQPGLRHYADSQITSLLFQLNLTRLGVMCPFT